MLAWFVCVHDWCVCVPACMCACVCACVRLCVCACVHVCQAIYAKDLYG